jgi:hypothetical protein
VPGSPLSYSYVFLFVDRSKQPFFEKSAINETSFEWTGVDKNRQTYANLSKIGVKIGVINNYLSTA